MKLINKANDLIADITDKLDDGSIEPFNEVEWLLVDCKDIISKLVEDNIRLTDKLINTTKNEQ